MSDIDRSGLNGATDWVEAVQDSLARHAGGLDKHDDRLERIKSRLDALVQALNLHNDTLRDMRDKMAVQSAHDLP